MSYEDFVNLVAKMRNAQKLFLFSKPGTEKRSNAQSDMVQLQHGVDEAVRYFYSPQIGLFPTEHLSKLVRLDNEKTVKIQQKEADPITNRIQAGGDKINGYYLVFQGEPYEIVSVLELVLEKLKESLPPIASQGADPKEPEEVKITE